MSERRLGRVTRVFRHPAAAAGSWEQLNARLAEQDAAIARLHLALEKMQLALDKRILDHYALTELAMAEVHLRADAIDSALASPDGPVAELLAAEGALIDSYLIHHAAVLREELAKLAERPVDEPGARPAPEAG